MKPTQAEVAELVTELRASQWPNATLQYRAADAIEALAGEGAEPMQEWRDDELAAVPTPKAQVGTWTLTAPDGRTWQADSPLRCVGDEMKQRVPPDVALARIAREISAPPAKPAGELPPLPEPTQEGCKCRKSRGYEWLEYSASEMRAYALRALRESR